MGNSYKLPDIFSAFFSDGRRYRLLHHRRQFAANHRILSSNWRQNWPQSTV